MMKWVFAAAAFVFAEILARAVIYEVRNAPVCTCRRLDCKGECIWSPGFTPRD